MPALPDVLSEAVSRNAFEVVMETGQPVILNTDKGGVPMGEALSEEDLFAALTDVLSEEQQVELMVGNVVEFDLTAAGVWRVLTEPGRDGIAIRARLSGQRPARGVAGPAIDLPHVAPFAVGASELPLMAEDSFSSLAVQRPTPREVAAVDLASEFDGLPPRGASSFGGVDEFDGVPEERADEDSDFLLLDAPTRPTPPPTPLRTDTATRRDIGAVRPVPHDSGTRLGLAPPPPSPGAGTRSDLGMVVDRTPPVSGTLAQVVRRLPAPGLTFVHGLDVDQVARLLGRATVLIDDASEPAHVYSALRPLPRGSAVVMRVEDPSRWLGFVLRRLEEGYSFLLETRADTPGGAHRSLLGPDATVRAESWLGRHTVRSLIESDGVWTLLLPT